MSYELTLAEQSLLTMLDGTPMHDWGEYGFNEQQTDYICWLRSVTYYSVEFQQWLGNKGYSIGYYGTSSYDAQMVRQKMAIQTPEEED